MMRQKTVQVEGAEVGGRRKDQLLRETMYCCGSIWSLFFFAKKKWQDGRNAYPAIVFLCSCETPDATLRDANFG